MSKKEEISQHNLNLKFSSYNKFIITDTKFSLLPGAEKRY